MPLRFRDLQAAATAASEDHNFLLHLPVIAGCPLIPDLLIFNYNNSNGWMYL